MPSNEILGVNAIYQKFFSIDHSSHYEKINFYRRNADQILFLPDRLRLEIQLDYMFSIFEIRDYRLFLKSVDWFISYIIEHNIVSIRGEDIFQKLLFHKAASFYNLGDIDQSLAICIQICRMNPQEKKFSVLCKKCIKIKQSSSLDFMKYTSVGLIIVSLIATVFQIEDISGALSGKVATIFLASSLLSLLLYEILLKIRMNTKFRSFLKQQTNS